MTLSTSIYSNMKKRTYFYRITVAVGLLYGASLCSYAQQNLTLPTAIRIAQERSYGCFGEIIHLSSLASFIKSIALLLLSMPLLRRAIADWRSGRHHTYCSFVHGNWSFYIRLVSVPSLFLPLLSWFVVNELPHDLYIPIFIGASVLLMSLCFYSLWRLDEFVSLYKERK